LSNEMRHYYMKKSYLILRKNGNDSFQKTRSLQYN